jgi:2-phospho-L-lactate guanylyltransferase
MAARVLDAARPLPVAVVCDDNDVADWARARGALVVWEPGRGLNGAVEAGVDHLRTAGVMHVTVSHADLPRASGLAAVGSAPGITLVPDRYGNGTNVIALPADAGFRFSYGPGSYARHRAEAERLGLELRVLDLPDLAWDLDEPADVVPVTAL